jgi:glycosyltransferase involved in cell wall biosynthesis
MKILVSTFTFFPNVDGVAIAAGQMADILRNAGYQVAIATSALATTNKTSGAKNDHPIHRFEINGSPACGAGFQGEISRYHDFIADFAPDVIFFHCWDIWTSEIVMALMTPIHQFKTVMVSHGYSSHILNLSILPRGLWKWIRWLPHVCTLPLRMRRFDRVVFLSNKSDWGRFFDLKIAQLTGACNTAVIPNGVPEFPKLVRGCFRKKLGISSGPMFLSIANYCIRKNQERALRAFARANLSEATLVFIGSELGNYGVRMVTLWKELQAKGAKGRVMFLEGLPRDETLSALRDCDVKILSSDAETQPIVLLEAMAASKPFISTRTGCVDEFKGGIVVRDVGQMSIVMRRLANSPELRSRLGEAGRLDYEYNYSIERTSKAWLELIHNLTNLA